ncbi:hypothetical protein QA597_02505 [Marinilabiliaceae bacterium ANBcel2]|nr:hypothetical protein [Marinilabiliaceae bacterium ANBcel2]
MKMLKNTITAAILLVFIAMISGCASIFSSSSYPLNINSNPANADITITNKKGMNVFIGKAPAVVNLKSSSGFFSKEEYQVKFSKPGFDDRMIPVSFNLDGWYFGNILIGGVIGLLIVDPATGAMWKIDTQYLNETLYKSSASLKPEMQLHDFNEVPDEWRQHMVAVQ